jgi:hypothetical protein
MAIIITSRTTSFEVPSEVSVVCTSRIIWENVSVDELRNTVLSCYRISKITAVVAVKCFMYCEAYKTYFHFSLNSLRSIYGAN